jgi:hypothetical protein
MAWGPIHLADPGAGDQAGHRIVDVVACGPLLAASIWGLASLQRSDWPAPLRQPCAAFFALASLLALSTAAYRWEPTAHGDALNRVFAVGSTTMLVLAFLAERVDALFGSGPAVLGTWGLVASGALWWLTGDWVHGRGDLRALLFLEYLPFLLVPAGALRLPGRLTRSRDWLALLGLYAVALAARSADHALLAVTHHIDGAVLMHLLLAAMTAGVAYRAFVASGAQRLATPSPSDPTQRSTSLNTSS